MTVELQYIRSGQHNLSKSLLVLSHEEMLVDWVNFWLNAHEAVGPEEVEQYARWPKLRDEHQAGTDPRVPSPTGQRSSAMK
jgi:hypothetical protein